MNQGIQELETIQVDEDVHLNEYNGKPKKKHKSYGGHPKRPKEKSPLEEKFIERVKTFVRLKDWTQAEAGEHLSVYLGRRIVNQTAHDAVNGKVMVTLRHVWAWSRAFDVPVRALFEEEWDSPPLPEQLALVVRDLDEADIATLMIFANALKEKKVRETYKSLPTEE